MTNSAMLAINLLITGGGKSEIKKAYYTIIIIYENNSNSHLNQIIKTIASKLSVSAFSEGHASSIIPTLKRKNSNCNYV
jgi:hypothetical protein